MDAANLGQAPQETPVLSDRDREILEFERHWWKYAGVRGACAPTW